VQPADSKDKFIYRLPVSTGDYLLLLESLVAMRDKLVNQKKAMETKGGFTRDDMDMMTNRIFKCTSLRAEIMKEVTSQHKA
jgi:hypothetical protein